MNEEKPKTLAESVQASLGVLSLAAVPAELVIRKPGSEGWRYYGPLAFLMCFAPMALCANSPHRELGAFATYVLLGLWLVRRLLSLRNRGRCHPRDVGHTFPFRRIRPAAELVYGLAVAWWLESLRLYPLPGIMAISAVANAIVMRAVIERNKREDLVMDEAVWRAAYMADRLERRKH